MVDNTITGSQAEGISTASDLNMTGVQHTGIDPPPDYAAFNTINDNFLGGGSNPAQITITSGRLWLTQNPSGTNNIANSGQNSITANGGTSILIHGDGAAALDASNTWFGSSSPSVVNFNFTGTLLTGAPTIPSFSCGSLNDVVGHKEIQIQSIQSNSDTNCWHIPGYADEMINGGLYDEAYDTMKYYIKQCTASADSDPAVAFGYFHVAGRDTVLTARGNAQTKAFLLSVLPLRTDDDWFCQCVLSLSVCFPQDSGNQYSMSLSKWLLDNPRCANMRSEDSTDYVNERFDDYSLWLDTTHWPDTVYDTTLLTMQQMGLDSVLIISATEGVSPEAIGSQILLSACILENPFPNSTSILLSIGREAYVTIQVFDILGHQIEGAGYASVFEQGSPHHPARYGKCTAGRVSRSHLHGK